MISKRHRVKGFTIVELLVVISIITLLLGMLLPAVGKARDNAKEAVSRNNLRQLGLAMQSYASDWQDRQYTPVVDTLASYGSVAAYNNQLEGGGIGLDVHPMIPFGRTVDGRLMGYFMELPESHWALHPIHFAGQSTYLGWFRFPNVKPIHSYLGGRVYDPVFYAPKDRLSLAAAEPCMGYPGEVPDRVDSDDEGTDPDCHPLVRPSYCFSPAALFSPAVFRPDDPDRPEGERGFQNPWSLPSGFRVPSMSHIQYPALKTHMLEHHWLQNVEIECNPAFGNFGQVLDCESYYFNHALTSSPVTLFYDGHVELVSAHEAMLADRRHKNQAGYGLWSRDTPMGDNGYMIDLGYDFAATSFHILTTDGAFGRDFVGGE